MGHQMIGSKNIPVISAKNMTPPTHGQAPNFNPYRQGGERAAHSSMNREGSYIPPGTGNIARRPPLAITAPIVDACPAFTPATYSQWKREAQLWTAAQNGETQTQLLPKLISILPQRAKVSG